MSINKEVIEAGIDRWCQQKQFHGNCCIADSIRKGAKWNDQCFKKDCAHHEQEITPGNMLNRWRQVQWGHKRIDKQKIAADEGKADDKTKLQSRTDNHRDISASVSAAFQLGKHRCSCHEETYAGS